MPSSMIDEFTIPHIPLKVNLEHLSPNNKLLTNEQITRVIKDIEIIKKSAHKTLRREHFAQRFKKTALNTPYDIIVFDENYYAIYYGVQRSKHVGSGGFGYVKLVQNIKSGEWAVLKLTAVDKKHNEYLLLRKVNLALGYLERTLPIHKENYFVKSQKTRNKHGAATSSSLHQANLLMKLAEGIDLDELARSNYNLPMSKWIEIILQVSKEYKQLKDKSIIHKDLKPKNIFYSFSKNKATIIDLGGSTKKSFFALKKEKEIYTMGYVAPELLFKTHYNEATDIYALGKTFLHLLDLNGYYLAKKEVQLYYKLYKYCYYHMADDEAKDRPCIEQAIEFFKTLQYSCTNLLPKPFRKIALFSIDEYLHYLNETQNNIHEEEPISSPTLNQSLKNYAQAFTSALKLFDEVWFIDTSKGSQKNYIQLHRDLSSQKIIVGQRCFLTEDKNLHSVVSAIEEKIKTKNLNQDNKYFFITTQTEIQDLADICPIILKTEEDDGYYQKIIDAYTALDIHKEYQIIKESLAVLANQYDIVKDTLKDFEKRFSEGKLSFYYLKDTLRELSEQLPALEEKISLVPNHNNIKFFSKFKPSKSQSLQSIKQIDAQIDGWVSSYQM
ncbi:serine/threonine-protein kinase [Legionella busanensis]|uniref:non-specific serine/threonine protein kinase n=1 Tax=Legionella busanensis TaxID=190655 RepID=A0A378JI89_9GAMM|nr:protein kinase [Legionella busanensis]STX51026.1 serine/threonine-protein kinase [Legionella busanensis]